MWRAHGRSDNLLWANRWWLSLEAWDSVWEQVQLEVVKTVELYLKPIIWSKLRRRWLSMCWLSDFNVSTTKDIWRVGSTYLWSWWASTWKWVPKSKMILTCLTTLLLILWILLMIWLIRGKLSFCELYISISITSVAPRDSPTISYDERVCAFCEWTIPNKNWSHFCI